MPHKSATDEDEREYLHERATQYGDENLKFVRIQKTVDPLVSLLLFISRHTIGLCNFSIDAV